MRRQDIYAIRIHNNRAGKVFKDSFHHRKHTVRLSKSRSDQHSVHLRQPTEDPRNCRSAELSILLRQRKDNGFVQLYRFYLINTLWNAQKYQARTCSKSRPGRQRGRAGKSTAAAKEQYFSKATFMRPGVPIRQQGQNSFMIQNTLIHSSLTFIIFTSIFHLIIRVYADCPKKSNSRKNTCIMELNMLILSQYAKAMIGSPCTDNATHSESGTVGAAWVQYRAFPQELRSEPKVGLAGWSRYRSVACLRRKVYRGSGKCGWYRGRNAFRPDMQG